MSERVRSSHHPWGTLVELCAPQVRNALDADAVAALSALFAADSADADGVVLLAAEGPVFCAGGDVGVLSAAAGMGELGPLFAASATAFADLVESIVSCPRPVVAVVQGAAVGGGLSLALACDVRIASPSARLVPGWSSWGLPPDGCASALLALALGPSRARSLLVAGEELAADSPLASLVFSAVVPEEALRAAGVVEAQRLAALAGARAAKAVTRSMLLSSLRAQREVELVELARAAADPAVVAALRRSSLPR